MIQMSRKDCVFGTATLQNPHMPIAKEYTRYVILLAKVPGRETPPDVVQHHVAHLQKLDHEGRLVLCGPFTDHASGMVIVKARDKEEAPRLAKADPFVIEGVRTFEIRTWLLACAENNYLAS